MIYKNHHYSIELDFAQGKKNYDVFLLDSTNKKSYIGTEQQLTKAMMLAKDYINNIPGAKSMKKKRKNSAVRMTNPLQLPNVRGIMSNFEVSPTLRGKTNKNPQFDSGIRIYIDAPDAETAAKIVSSTQPYKNKKNPVQHFPKTGRGRPRGRARPRAV